MTGTLRNREGRFFPTLAGETNSLTSRFCKNTDTLTRRGSPLFPRATGSSPTLGPVSAEQEAAAEFIFSPPPGLTQLGLRRVLRVGAIPRAGRPMNGHDNK